MSARVYIARALPTHVVLDHEDALWLAPSHPGGWRRRTPYAGHRRGLVALSEAEARLVLDAIGYGEPDPRPPYPSDALCAREAAGRTVVSVTMPVTLRDAIDAAVGPGGRSAWVAEACRQRLERG